MKGVSSEVGVGTTFSFYIRASATSNAAPNGEDETITRKASITSQLSNDKFSIQIPVIGRGHDPHERATPDMLHILLVEDNLINQQVTAKQLQRAGHVVHVANHGLEALDILQKSKFFQEASKGDMDHDKEDSTALSLSVALIDLEMPVCDGLTAIDKIRAMETQGTLRPHVPCIAVTANARLEQKAEALERGFDMVLTKPFKMKELITRIDSLLQTERR